MKALISTAKLVYLLCFLLILAGCKKKSVDPEPLVPMGKAFITIETDGKKQTYVEGNPGVESLNIFGTSTKHDNVGHGGGIRIDKVSWEFFFYFPREEYLSNTGNFAKLFKPGKLDYLTLDRSFNYTKINGVTINRGEQVTANTGRYANSEYQENSNPQNFEISDAYFYNSTYDRFIWVEGSFDCSIGFFDDLKKVKGKFRIKVQHNDE